MKFHYCLVALAALACNGQDSDKTGATGDSTTDTDTDTGPTGTDCAPNGPFTGPITITSAMVTCAGEDATYEVETEGVTGGGWVFSQETGSTYPAGQWADNHDLDSYEFDAACNTYDKLNQTVTGGAAGGADVRNESSIFTCANHYEDNAFMTFAFGVADASGNLTDCYAFGGDVAGMIAGDYTIIGQDPDFDLSGCRAGTEGM